MTISHGKPECWHFQVLKEYW